MSIEELRKQVRETKPQSDKSGNLWLWGALAIPVLAVGLAMGFRTMGNGSSGVVDERYAVATAKPSSQPASTPDDDGEDAARLTDRQYAKAGAQVLGFKTVAARLERCHTSTKSESYLFAMSKYMAKNQALMKESYAIDRGGFGQVSDRLTGQNGQPGNAVARGVAVAGVGINTRSAMQRVGEDLKNPADGFDAGTIACSKLLSEVRRGTHDLEAVR